MNLYNRLIYLFLILTSLNLEAATYFELAGKKKQTREAYLKIHKKFSNQVCKGGVDSKHSKLFKDFQKTKLFIPTFLDGSLDRASVELYLKRLKEKNQWLKNIKSTLTQTKSFKKELKLIAKSNNSINKLLIHKRNFNISKKSSSRKKWAELSRKERLKLKKYSLELFKSVPYLLGFEYPVDHLNARLKYDTLKKEKTEDSKALSNKIYLERRLHEDGATNSDGKRSDQYLRTTINTIFYKLNENNTFLSEVLRYDLTFVLRSIKKHIKSGRGYMLGRLTGYQKRISNSIDFYSHLMDKVGEQTVGTKLLNEKAKSTYELKKYSLTKQAEAYKFWSNQSELMQAIFTIETILFNEVGRADPYYYERRDVTKIVMNRGEIPFYSSLTLDDSIFYYLSAANKKNMSANHWLNVLFKEGEFSFTYFFIPSNSKIYCPDMSKSGKSLRAKNINVAMNMLSDRKYKFNGLRYFSRESMTGRIDMSSIWDNFSPVREAPGGKIGRSANLIKKYKKAKFKYLYHFIDRHGEKFEVVEISGREYVFNHNQTSVYRYRNPHKFKYFELKD